jgi:hypothetical protein
MNPSPHARLRCAQRNLRPERLAYVLRHGTRIRRTGVTFVVLRRRDIPVADRRCDAYAKLEGTVLLLGRNDRLVTAYRNRGALRAIRKKQKGRAAGSALGPRAAVPDRVAPVADPTQGTVGRSAARVGRSSIS